MNRKAKGITAERELVHLFWKAGWAAVRTPASGSVRHPNPDLIASNKVRTLAIECKSTADSAKYLSEYDITELRTFAATFGAEPWIGVRFNREGWFFVSVENLARTKGGYKVSLKDAKLLGHSFAELIA